jgi:hypothetical protein
MRKENLKIPTQFVGQDLSEELDISSVIHTQQGDCEDEKENFNYNHVCIERSHGIASVFLSLI